MDGEASHFTGKDGPHSKYKAKGRKTTKEIPVNLTENKSCYHRLGKQSMAVRNGIMNIEELLDFITHQRKSLNNPDEKLRKKQMASAAVSRRGGGRTDN